MIRLRRDPQMIAGEGHSAGQWLVCGLPLMLCGNIARRTWDVLPHVPLDGPLDDFDVLDWLADHDLDGTYERRKDAVAALDAALSVSSPPNVTAAPRQPR